MFYLNRIFNFLSTVIVITFSWIGFLMCFGEAFSFVLENDYSGWIIAVLFVVATVAYFVSLLRVAEMVYLWRDGMDEGEPNSGGGTPTPLEKRKKG